MKQDIRDIKYMLSVPPLYKYCSVCMLIKNEPRQVCVNCSNNNRRIIEDLIGVFK